MTKRIFSILLALCMVFAFMPASAFAANPDTDITISVVDADDKPVTEVYQGQIIKVKAHVPAFKNIRSIDVQYSNGGKGKLTPINAPNTSTTFDFKDGLNGTYNYQNYTMAYSIVHTDGYSPFSLEETSELVQEFQVSADAAVNESYQFTIDEMNTSVSDKDTFENIATFTGTTTASITVIDKPSQAEFKFTSADEATYGDTLKLVATGGSTDAAVDYLIKDGLDVADLAADGTLTFKKAGEVTVEATKAGNAEYKEATATQTITVNKAEVTVTAKDRNIKVGETAPVLGKVKDTDYTVAGLVGNDELTDVTLSYASTPDTTKAGSVDINVTATADNAKYTVKTLKGTLTISDKTAQTGFDFANAKTTTYGKTLKLDAKGGAGTGAVTYEITRGSDVADLAADGTLTFKKAGEVIVKATKAADAEYAEATATQTITVNKADVTVTAKDRTIKVKETAPVLGKVKDTDYTVAGLVGNDELTDVTLSYASTPDTTKAGSVDINVTATADNAKYTVKTVKGKLTISDASTGGGGGGIIIPPIVQNPEIKLVEATMGKAELSADGTTATITPNDGYEIDKVTVNDKEVTITDNKITGLKAGDKVVVTFKAKAAPEPEFDVQKYVSDLKLVARSTKTAKGNIKVAVKTVTDQNGTAVNLSDLKDKGYTVKYKFYRSNKKVSKYAAKTEKTIDKNSYVNTTGKKGTKYFYKVRVMVYDNDGKLVAKSELKQCKYASRIWTKK